MADAGLARVGGSLAAGAAVEDGTRASADDGLAAGSADVGLAAGKADDDLVAGSADDGLVACSADNGLGLWAGFSGSDEEGDASGTWEGAAARPEDGLGLRDLEERAAAGAEVEAIADAGRLAASLEDGFSFSDAGVDVDAWLAWSGEWCAFDDCSTLSALVKSVAKGLRVLMASSGGADRSCPACIQTALSSSEKTERTRTP